MLAGAAGCVHGTYNRNYQPNKRAYEQQGNINRDDLTYTQRLIQREQPIQSAGLEAGDDSAFGDTQNSIQEQVNAANDSGFNAELFMREGSVRPQLEANTPGHEAADPQAPFTAIADADSGVYLPDGIRSNQPQPVGNTSSTSGGVPESASPDRSTLIVNLFDATATQAQRDEDPFAKMVPVALLGLDEETTQNAIQLNPSTLNNLTPEERTMLDALRTVGRSMMVENVLDRSPGSLARTLSSIAHDLSASEPISISDAAMCTRIFGYGRYELQPGNRFVAGRPNRVSIYTELENFGTRDARSNDPGVMPGDTIATEVSQTIVLFSSGIQAWSVPKQSVVLPGKKPQRDLFLRQVIDLPANLTIGKYEMKIIVRDETDGSVAETILPLEIVAAMGG